VTIRKNKRNTHSKNCDQFWNGCIWHQLLSEHTNCGMTEVVIWSNAAESCRRQTVIILHATQSVILYSDPCFNKELYYEQLTLVMPVSKQRQSIGKTQVFAVFCPTSASSLQVCLKWQFFYVNRYMTHSETVDVLFGRQRSWSCTYYYYYYYVV